MTGGYRISGARYLVPALLLLGACGKGDQAARLTVRFAHQSYLQTAADGLPQQVASLKVTVHQGQLLGQVVYESACRDVSTDSGRQQLVLDIPAGTGLLFAVSAYQQAGCPSGQPQWLGTSAIVDVVAGEQITVPVYVVRRGDSVNLVRDSLRPARAYATATTLADGRVLLAGGFESLQSSGDQVQLEASNRAVLYDPGRAEFLPTGSLSEPRGGHQALLLADGRVLLVGGSRRLTVNYRAGNHFSLAPDQVLATVDIYDPATGTFSTAAPDPLLQRFGVAAAVLGDGSILLAGGKTNLERSDELILGAANGSTFEWSRLSQHLLAPRKGARILLLDGADSVLVGGGSIAQPALEFADATKLEFQPVETAGTDDLLAVGMQLSASGAYLIWSGGLPAAAGQQPSAALVLFDEAGLQLQAETTMTRARAYHLAAALPDPGHPAEGRLLLAGGIAADFLPSADLEICTTGGPACSALAVSEPGIGALGVASAELPDGSVLLAGGLDWQAGQFVLSGEARLFSP